MEGEGNTKHDNRHRLGDDVFVSDHWTEQKRVKRRETEGPALSRSGFIRISVRFRDNQRVLGPVPQVDLDSASRSFRAP